MMCRLSGLMLSLLALLFVLEVNALKPQNFLAVRKNALLRRKDASLGPTLHGQYLMYADYDIRTDEQPLSALRLSLFPKKPTVILEDLLLQLQSIDCHTSHINVQFSNLVGMRAAQESWQSFETFLLVTSDTACAPDGEHAVYDVSYRSNDISARTITLNSSRTSLRDCTHKMVVDLGPHVIPDVDRRLSRRLAEPQAVTLTSSVVGTATFPLATTLSFAPPTATAASEQISGDVSFNKLNTTLFPPDSAIVDFVPQLQGVQGFELRCANCSLHGQLQLRAAGFSIDSSELGQFVDFIDDGYFEFNAIGMTANMAFDFDFQPGFAVAVPFVPQLPEIQLTPFGIPGVITFGPSLQLLFPMQITLNSAVKFSTGFTLTVPENSSLVLNVSHVGSSYSTGFQDTELRPIPFVVDADDLSLNFTAGFRPQLMLSPGLISSSGTFFARGGVGAFLDLPSYTATVTAVKDKAENCVDPAPSNERNLRIYMEPSISIGGGVLWEIEMGITGNISLREASEEVLFRTTRPLPVQCLLLHSETRSTNQANAGAAGSDKAHNSGDRLQAWTGFGLLLLGGTTFSLLF